MRRSPKESASGFKLLTKRQRIQSPIMSDHLKLARENLLEQSDAGSAFAIAERPRAQARGLELSVSSLEAISQALTLTTEGVDVLLQTIARTVAEIFDASCVSVVVNSGYKQRRAIYETGGGHQEMLPAALPENIRGLNDGDLGHVSAKGDIVCVPMLKDGRPEGWIRLKTTAARELDANEAAMLQTLATQSLAAIQNAKQFEESLYLHAQTEELYRIAVQQKNEAERKQVELQAALDEIDSMEREQIISAERERIARGLHDDVAQILVSMGLNLEWCRQHLPAESPVQERLTCLKDLARTGLFEVRNAILGLSSVNISELGLPTALENLVGDFEKISRLPSAFQMEGATRQLPLEVDNALYYIAQEALYNVFKHARASHVHVKLVFESEAMTLTVTDDGIGIGKCQDGERRSTVTFGTKNMLRRAEELGGSLLIGDAEGKGTRVVARIPG